MDKKGLSLLTSFDHADFDTHSRMSYRQQQQQQQQQRRPLQATFGKPREEEAIMEMDRQQQQQQQQKQQQVAMTSTAASTTSVKSSFSFRDQRRSESLKRCRELASASNFTLASKSTAGERVKITQIDTLLRDRVFATSVFNLFDQNSRGTLNQIELFETLRVNIRSSQFDHLSLDARLDLVDLLESIAYAICQEEDLSRDSFQRVLTGRGVPNKLYKLANHKGGGDGVSELEIEELMNFLIILSNPRHANNFNADQVKDLEDVFLRNLPTDKDQLTLGELKKFLPAKNTFFVERAFSIFDKDGNGQISLTEFIDSMYGYACQDDPSEKMAFLFRIYDIDGDGRLQEEEIESVMRACVQESGMELPESDIQALATALYDEARSTTAANVDNVDDVDDVIMDVTGPKVTGLATATATAAKDDAGGINTEQLMHVFGKHPGLIENLTFSLSSWLLPSGRDGSNGTQRTSSSSSSNNGFQNVPSSSLPSPSSSSCFSCVRARAPFRGALKKLRGLMAPKYYKSQRQLRIFIYLLILLNLLLMISRAMEFVGFKNLDGSKPNIFYMTSRACGRGLLLDSVLVFVLVLRYCITKLRNLGASCSCCNYLPLDHNIYLHKVVGTLILVLSWVHSCMHVCNFFLNLYPDPVRFLQLNSKYWDVPRHVETSADETKSNWQRLDYNVPNGCNITLCLSASDDGDGDGDVGGAGVGGNSSVGGSVGSDPDAPQCQVCRLDPAAAALTNGAGHWGPWTASDWLFTARPGLLGLVGGWALPTGFALWAIISIMALCSMPFVRKSGYFQVFYFTHLLYWPYVLLLIAHAPDFWKWILLPLALFAMEKAYRAISTLVGNGKTNILEGTTMASRVTKLVIKRPLNFKFSAGDWVFVRIPKIAIYEWHPFTISSAPEQPDTLTLHVRGVGEWTNRLYDFFEKKKQQHGREMKRLSRGRSLRDDFGQFHFEAATASVSSGPVAGASASASAGAGAGLHSFGSVSLPLGAPAGRGGGGGGGGGGGERTFGDWGDVREKRMEVHLDGPFGAPASNMFRAEHAVLIATGIGVTPFSSILQSIMYRYQAIKRQCPNCQHKWTEDLGQAMIKLKKVDFFWINRDQKSFEWFISLLDQMEKEQLASEHAHSASATPTSSTATPPGGHGQRRMEHFLEFHLHFTKALQSTDMRAVGLQLAMDLLHKKEKRDLMTGLRVRTNAGRPNWNRVFSKLRDGSHGRVTVFFCGNRQLAKVLRQKCDEFGFYFRKESF